MTGWPCHRCGAHSVVAILRSPGTWTTTGGVHIPVTNERHLCVHCDAAAQCGDAAEVLVRWITTPHAPMPDQEALSAEIDAWRGGTL